MKKLIFHIDVNSAYLSWEAARLVKNGKSDIRLIPSAIGGDRQKRTGIILAKSIPAKRYGVTTGEPISMALRKCPNLFLVKPDFALYERCSKEFINICKEYAPVVEQFSIDECFLDMSGTEYIYEDPIKVAYEIKDKIRDTLGFTVNVGVSTNKLLAKMASEFDKPDKVNTLFESEIKNKMWPLPIRELFSVGEATAMRLKKAYIETIGDLAKFDVNFIKSLVGEKLGEQIHNYANGIDNTPVLAEPEAVKGYSISTTLSEDITDIEDAYKVLLSLADSVSSRMRSDRGKAYCINVGIRENDFKNRSHQRKLTVSTDITDEIFAISKVLLDELWDKQTPIRLIGISLTNITKEGSDQEELFPDERKEKLRKVDKAVDLIRYKYGTNVIVKGSTYNSSLEVGKKYKAQMENKREPK